MYDIFADIILPLKLQGTFTYKVPTDFAMAIKPGHRVVVQFGRQQKMYTAIVLKVHRNKPELGIVKSILSLADEEPVVLPVQLQFWQWMASYYLCTLGEVMNAALPSALKLDSTTIVEMDPYWDEHEHDEELTDREFVVMETLRHEGPLKIEELQKQVDIRAIHPLIKSLLGKGAILIKEELEERFKPKTEVYLYPANDMGLDELAVLGNDLKRAPKQEQALVAFLEIMATEGEASRKEVCERAGVDTSVIKKLIEKGLLVAYDKTIGRLATLPDGPPLGSIDLTPIQQQALTELNTGFETHDVALLHGVTGSGKTLIYLHLAQQAIAEGKQVLYLLPEIALTAQMINRLREKFGDKVGIYHSKFNDQERVEIWQKVLTGEYSIVLGARSAVFLPFQQLGLVIVDEEHENSYKQYDPAPRYHGRDAAIFLAYLHQCKTLLGTATPSLETYFNGRHGKYAYVRLMERHGGTALPEIRIVDVKDLTKRKAMKSHFSPVLLDQMQNSFDQNGQVILFQNKRGFAPYLMCVNCSWIPKCRNCDVSLTYHKHSDTMRCHYCGYGREMPPKCENCGQVHLRIFGFGTEKIEEELPIFFPKVRVARFDLDSTRGKEGHNKIIDQFQNHELDVLVGTQMVTKGLDFGDVNLVGILSADQLLAFPDFRSHERAFQLMEQVSGRAGRRDKQGLVLIQAMDPEHPVVLTVKNGQWEQLYEQELKVRQQFHYPPYTRLIEITVKHIDRALTLEAAKWLTNLLRPQVSSLIMGPVAPFVSRVKNQYLQSILIKIPKDSKMLPADKKAIVTALEQLNLHKEFKKVTVVVNVDP